MLSIPILDALLLTGLFGASGVLHLAGPRFLRLAYRRWGFPGNAHRVVGVLEILAALFLSNPVTRIWGVILAGFIIFFATVALLNHGKITANTVKSDVAAAHKVFEDLKKAGISMHDVTSELTVEGVKSFAESYNEMLAAIGGKQKHLTGVGS